MAKQTFTTGQVLLASQLTSLQQTALGGGAASAKVASYTLVAADAGTAISMTNASATTITVNQGLFAAGDTVAIQNLGAGVCTVTAGTATVNTAGSLALSQYEGGVLYFVSSSAAILFDYTQAGAAASLVKIAQTSFTAVSSQAFDNCFSATYKHYIVTLDGFFGSTSSADLLYQARTSAGGTISTNYYGGTLKLTYNSTTPTNITHDAASAITITQDVGDSANLCGGILFITTTTGNVTSVSGFYTNGNSAITNSPNVATNGSGGNAGFLLSVSTGTLTGRATVYGVAE